LASALTITDQADRKQLHHKLSSYVFVEDQGLPDLTASRCAAAEIARQAMFQNREQHPHHLGLTDGILVAYLKIAGPCSSWEISRDLGCSQGTALKFLRRLGDGVRIAGYGKSHCPLYAIARDSCLSDPTSLDEA
jgi:hypothetical protein